MLIFLVGFMGSGKTHWGERWAEANDIPFVDLDDAIETAERKTVAEIFAINGEAHFREVESKILHSFAGQKNMIIACGGGTPCFNNNMQWMNDQGTTIYFTSPPDIIMKRVITQQDKRPLLKDMNPIELLVYIEQTIMKREPYYTQAKIILVEAEVTVETFAKEIINH